MIEAPLLHKLLMDAAFDDPPLLDDQDLVGKIDHGKAVGDNKCGSIPDKVFYRIFKASFRFYVEF